MTNDEQTKAFLDSDLVERAQYISGIQDQSVLLNEALVALIQRESAKYMAGLGGSQPNLLKVPRRQPAG